MEEKETQEGDFKMKKKPKNLTQQESISDVKVDLSSEIKEDIEKEVDVVETKEDIQEEPVLSEIVKEETEINKEVEATQNNLPENIEKLVGFMNETGGTVEDYVRLNTDYSKVDNDILLKEYYKNTKPHLNVEEIEYILEDSFSFDEDVDEERDVKKKQIALKEEVVKARGFLEEVKSKYYEEIKFKPNTNKEQQKALEFFNNHKKTQDLAKQQHESFKQNTKKFFSNDFKGFDFNVGEKSFNYKVNNAQGVADAQSDISTFIKKFLNEDGSVQDQAGYHKAIYAARHADTIAKHFYEQGKADASKNILAQSKNISNEARPNPSGEVFVNGLKVKAVTGGDGSKLKIKRRT